MTYSERRLKSRRGGTLVEFALMSFLLVMLLLSTIEFERMVLVYTSVAQSARAGLRYAVVHGFLRTGIGVNGPSGLSAPGCVTVTPPTAPPASIAQIVNITRNFASTGMMDTSKLKFKVCYVGPPSPPYQAGLQANHPGSTVTVKVEYPYDPFVGFWGQLRVNLSSQAAGVITY